MMDTASQLEAGGEQYGATEARKLLKKMEKAEKKKNNFGLLLWCLVVPMLIFVATYYSVSFIIRYLSSLSAYIIIGFTALASLNFGWMALGSSGCCSVIPCFGWLLDGRGSDANWLWVMFFLSAGGWIWATYDGNNNYQAFMQPFFDLQQLNTYQSINVTASTGNQYMDFATLGFIRETKVDIKHAMAFKSGSTYCVAPIKVGDESPSSYDFWAVGMDCCTSKSFPTRNFHCGAKDARHGLRVVREADRGFYQLAVKQAAATYDIPVKYPIYFEMVDDPSTTTNLYQDAGWRRFISMFWRFLCVEVVAIVVATFAFSKF